MEQKTGLSLSRHNMKQTHGSYHMSPDSIVLIPDVRPIVEYYSPVIRSPEYHPYIPKMSFLSIHLLIVCK